MRISTLITTAVLCIAATDVHAESIPTRSSSGAWCFLFGVFITGAAFALSWFWNKQRPSPIVADAFAEQCITQTFISALPTLTRELNLEIAKTFQMETLERVDTRIVLGINLGTNQATIRAPVTYRYHIRLQDSWQLSRKGNAVLVKAPVIRASQPPAIHTEQMEIRSSRGWCRSSPEGLVQQLHRDLTPTLCNHADDPRRIGIVRETARHSVAEFVRLWLAKENQWNRWKFTSIHVCFRDEATMPMQPTLQLTENQNVQLH